MNKTAKIILWSVVGVSTIGIGFYLYKILKPATNPVDDLDIPEIPPTSGGTSSGNVIIPSSNAIFPLSIGSRGELVKALQRKLGITADGIFGNQTNTAIQRAGYPVPLSEVNYNKILGINQNSSPTTQQPTAPTGFKTADAVYLKDAGLAYYSFPSTAPSYLKGTIKRTDVLANQIGVYLAPAANGFSKVKLITSKGRDVENKLVALNSDYFVLTSKISKTPY